MANETFEELLQKSLTEKKDYNVDTTGAEFKTEVDTTEKENKPEAQTEPKVEDKKEVLSNTEKPTTDKEVKAEEVKTEVKSKTLEELIAERTEGKIKSWDEIEAKLNEPKIEFADERVQKINDFVKAGGKIDQNWLYFQNTDFDKVSDPFDLLAEAMRLDEPGITDKEIEYRIKNDYKTDEWAEEEGEVNEVEEVMSAKMLREADKARQKLKEFQSKSSFAPAQKSEADLQKEAKIKQDVQKNWEKSVDDNVKGFEKIPVKIDDKDTFEVIVSEDERKGIATMAKALGTSMSPLISKFLDDRGNIDVKKMQNYLYKAENFDNAVKTGFLQGLAKGKESVVKDIKNVNFKGDGKPETARAKSLAEQIGEQIAKNELS